MRWLLELVRGGGLGILQGVCRGGDAAQRVLHRGVDLLGDDPVRDAEVVGRARLRVTDGVGPELFRVFSPGLS